MDNFHVSLLSLLLLSLVISPPTTTAQLRQNYYANICPNVESVVRGAVIQKMQQTPIAAPAALRLLFHDCFVRGCDASVMIISPNADDEWRSPEDMTLKPEGFDVILALLIVIPSAGTRCLVPISLPLQLEMQLSETQKVIKTYLFDELAPTSDC